MGKGKVAISRIAGRESGAGGNHWPPGKRTEWGCIQDKAISPIENRILANRLDGYGSLVKRIRAGRGENSRPDRRFIVQKESCTPRKEIHLLRLPEHKGIRRYARVEKGAQEGDYINEFRGK